MPKTFTAQSVQSINPIHFETKGGVVTGLIVNCEVNYGEVGMTHQVDIWGNLTPTQRDKAQKVYDFIRVRIEGIILS